MLWRATTARANDLRFGGKSVIVQDAAEFDWTQAQLAFFAAGVEAGAAYVEEAINAGYLAIDLSGPVCAGAGSYRWWCRT
ncbi:hypothetical protein MJ588_20395 [Klebsiella pneumoniae]|nr:hypothetical protein MJ588_20395 [Klebsiella pneumoniae]